MISRVSDFSRRGQAFHRGRGTLWKNEAIEEAAGTSYLVRSDLLEGGFAFLPLREE